MYMGSTWISLKLALQKKNHPHVYGEYLDMCRELKEPEESSPCIWGVLETLVKEAESYGIIPMYMGST